MDGPETGLDPSTRPKALSRLGLAWLGRSRCRPPLPPACWSGLARPTAAPNPTRPPCDAWSTSRPPAQPWAGGGADSSDAWPPLFSRRIARKQRLRASSTAVPLPMAAGMEGLAQAEAWVSGGR